MDFKVSKDIIVDFGHIYRYICETCIIVVKKSCFVHPTAALDRESKAWDMGDLPLPAGNTLREVMAGKETPTAHKTHT